jgi:hypothetical protein
MSALLLWTAFFLAPICTATPQAGCEVCDCCGCCGSGVCVCKDCTCCCCQADCCDTGGCCTR